MNSKILVGIRTLLVSFQFLQNFHSSPFFYPSVFLAFLVGGLLVCLTRDKAQSFCDELQAVDGHPAWIVGEVVYGNREVRIDEDLKVIEV